MNASVHGCAHTSIDGGLVGERDARKSTLTNLCAFVRLRVVATSTDSPSQAPAFPLAPGSIVGKFTIEQVIGVGGMCIVFQARHRDLQRAVALKVLKPELASQSTLVERFLDEGRKGARVRHPHVIDMIDVGESGGVVYLAMELLHGEDLAARLKREGPLDARVAVDLLLPVVAAIAEAHASGVVHRDIKPANIFLSADKHGHVEPKVLDFGISKTQDDDVQRQTATGTILGTPFYMAPEQVRGARHTTFASDQYSLGVVLYECVTGEVPFRGETVWETFQKVGMGEYTPPRAVVPSLPAGIEAIIARSMSVNPALRYESVTALGAALMPYASPGLRARWADVFPDASVTTPGTSRRYVVLALAITVSVAVAFAAAGSLWKRHVAPGANLGAASDAGRTLSPTGEHQNSPPPPTPHLAAAIDDAEVPTSAAPSNGLPRLVREREGTRRGSSRGARDAEAGAPDASRSGAGSSDVLPAVPHHRDASSAQLPGYDPNGVRVIN